MSAVKAASAKASIVHAAPPQRAAMPTHHHSGAVETGPRAPGAFWDFGKIAIVPPIPAEQPHGRALAAEGGMRLAVGRAGDPLEQEAERLADRAAGRSEARPPQRDFAVAPPIVVQALRASGRPLDAAARGRMEARLGRDFSGVRIHDDATANAAAAAIDAAAYTAGCSIVFGAGQYAPGSARGDRLIAHELAHVMQQVSGRPSIQRAPKSSGADALQDEVRALLDHTQERFNSYVTRLRPHYPNPSDLGTAAAKHLQDDFIAAFGPGVAEVKFTRIGSRHRIDLFLHDYNVGIELKLSGAVRAEQKHVFFHAGWGGKAAREEPTIAYVSREGWWAGAGSKLPPAKLKALRGDLARLEKTALRELEVGGKAARKAEEAGETARAERTAVKGAGKAGLIKKVIGGAATAVSGVSLMQNLRARNWGGAARDAFDLVAPELSLLAAAAGHMFGGKDAETPAPSKPEAPPRHLPKPGTHYFIVTDDGREIEVDALALLNDDVAHPVYPDETFPGEANEQWLRNRRLRLHEAEKVE